MIDRLTLQIEGEILKANLRMANAELLKQMFHLTDEELREIEEAAKNDEIEE